MQIESVLQTKNRPESANSWFSVALDQTGWMPRLIWVFAGHTVTLLVLLWGGWFMSACLSVRSIKLYKFVHIVLAKIKNTNKMKKYAGFLYPATQKVAGFYVIPSELWVSVRHASFPCSNFSTFWPIFFKLCTDIGIWKEWYGIACGLISFRNNSVCPSISASFPCFNFSNFDLFSSNFA